MVKDLATAAIVIVFASAIGAQYLGDKTQGGHIAPGPAEEHANMQQEAPVEKAAAPGSGRVVVLESDGRGHFAAALEVNGARFDALVDTGASVIALPKSVAGKIGLFPAESAYSTAVKTANGEVRAAPVMLEMVRLGGIEVRGVEAVILPDESLGAVLLGMSFLRRLTSFSIKDDRLTLVN